MTDSVMTRDDVASKLGRRVSKGEFERIFSKLTITDGPRGRHAVRHPYSPKARRKGRV